MSSTGLGGNGLLKGLVRGFNNGMVALMRLPVLGERMSGTMAEISYVGRRSGKTFRTPIAYRRDGDDIVIGVAMPDKKSWWRNFLGEGAPLTIHLREGDRTGHAVASRDEKGAVTVTVRFDQLA
ncbi:PNPOx family protein [Nocardia macrotermitis]|uniref:Nitroreductase family deazaflavin-dependent oxidoreductase n=1 Tax=Nocardia macrotermitis TaxID=2585198 RepID=A0A7K0CWC2_9NOCA|nr:nitroreductase/quinone reductase family protein [Nocardia macrotermitis]MQY17693.1 hypothetical protein [Nocardia macrotermitis]